MSRTLFWYIFKDLVRIFLLTSGALAGIMSFGGLLRPLTEHGLDVGQVGRMLTYFQPAMWTYALPVAALFATTMVYGRLSADNEIVACRAAGISHLALAFPALVLGMLIALVSLLLLCFIVPACMLKAERVVFSNVAQIVQNSIERTHQLKLLDQGRDPVTVFAESAYILPFDPSRPREQAVVLVEPMIITYEPLTPDQKNEKEEIARVPKDFFIAKKATAYITQNEETDELTFTAVPEGGIKFPRHFAGSSQGGIEYTSFTAKYPSLVRENTKFMDVWRLKELLGNPSAARRVRTLLVDFIANEQSDTYLKSIRDTLANGSTAWEATTSEGDRYSLVRGRAATRLEKRVLILGAAAGAPPDEQPVRVRVNRDMIIDARRVEMAAVPDVDGRNFNVTMDFYDATVKIGSSESVRERFSRSFTIPMPQPLANLPVIRTAQYYVKPLAGQSAGDSQKQLHRALTIIGNTVRSELHARVSFALSCLILVMVGCALGLMFRSGNFLSAFAISVVPALICIALIITGQHTCESVPWDVTRWHNSLKLGIGIIWSGNVAVAAIAVVLLGRLQRQ
jgi:lipopolysaccharide export LptBFGC system permease protein LptF